MGDKVTIDLIVYDDRDSLFYNSFDKHQRIPIGMQKSQFKGDLLEGIQLLSIGDSAVFLISSDSVTKLAKQAGNSSALKPGSFMKYIVVLRSITTKEELAEQQKMLAAKGQEQIKIDENNHRLH